ncbi:MAG: hypothetical protein MMC33_002998, partial [Icmadophila ericetorum]|nr:hypothetical protein [Icmadophila ericetorum]
HSDFKFFPIEPPRPAPNRRESYARRQHQFAPPIIGPTRGSLFRNPSIPEPGAVKPPMVSIDGRLPDPAIITCNEPLPLRILIKKLNDSPEVLFLRHLQIELVGNTNIRAHELVRQERMSWILVSLNNIQIPLTNSETPRDKEVEIDSSPWKSVPLPNTIAPSFDTCNLSRFYELEIKLGLSYGKSVNIKNEIYLQPLLMPVQLYSGIRPPPELLAKMSRPGQKPASLVPPLSRPPSNSAPPSPTPLSVPPPFQPGPPSAVGGPPGLEREEAPPPSYEDAIAEDIGPVDGPRRDYLQPERTTNVGERKRSGLGGRWGGGSGSGGMDERLFP